MQCITIDLDTSRYPHGFDTDESFWGEQIQKMKALLQEHRQLCRHSGNPGDALARQVHSSRRPHLAITVLGSRGSGKSSLLRTFERRLENVPDIELLPQIDPTQLSRHDNFLHAFMALLLEKIEDMAQTRGRAIHELECRKPLQQLADHLWTANGTPPRDEDDPVAASLERLDRHRSGPLLKRSLQDFLTAVARDLARMRYEHCATSQVKEMFMVLPIDDPDMAFDHFASILDLYRRYLRHPLLIPVFAFSKKLARELTTLHFGSYLGYEKDRIGDDVAFRAEVEELADQFLDKYLPPRSRIVLDLPQDKILNAGLRRSRSNGADGPESEAAQGRVGDLLQRGAELLFSRGDLKISLLPSSLRRILQLLDMLAEKLGLDETEPNSQAAGGRGLIDPRIFDTARAVLHVHQAALGRYGIDPETIFASPVAERGPRLLKQVLDAATRGHALPVWSETRVYSLLCSLLALSVFHPSAEETDTPQEPTEEWNSRYPTSRSKALNSEGHEEGKRLDEVNAGAVTADERLALRWLLRVLIGFYLPLRASTGTQATSEDGWGPDSTSRRLLLGPVAETFPGHLFVHPGGPIRIAVGEDRTEIEVGSLVSPLDEEVWRDYSCAPWLQIREENLVSRGEMFESPLEPFPGLSGLMKMLDPGPRLIVSIWTLCGTQPGPWSAVSLWRGLDLLLRLLEHPDDLHASIRLHARRAVTEQIPQAVHETLIDVDRLEVWSDDELDTASGELAEEVAVWLATAPPRLDQRRLIRSLQGMTIERDLLRPISTAGSKLGTHGRGGGTLLRAWLLRLQNYFGDLPWLTPCPLIRPLLSPVAEACWRLKTEGQQDSAEPDLDPRIEIKHELRPVEILDLLIPADYESYFDRFRRQLRDPDPAAMV